MTPINFKWASALWYSHVFFSLTSVALQDSVLCVSISVRFSSRGQEMLHSFCKQGGSPLRAAFSFLHTKKSVWDISESLLLHMLLGNTNIPLARKVWKYMGSREIRMRNTWPKQSCSNQWSRESSSVLHMFSIENICCFVQGSGYGGCINRDYCCGIHVL